MANTTDNDMAQALREAWDAGNAAGTPIPARREFEIQRILAAHESRAQAASAADGITFNRDNVIGLVHRILDKYPVDEAGRFRTLSASRLALAVEQAFYSAAPQPPAKDDE
jgi:hypothetical protein